MAALAQSDDDDGPGYLASLLQSALSGQGRDVQIRGFSGALSSQARLARLTIADAEGIWLVLEDAELDWNRSALLRGRVEVERLSAARIELRRPPVAEEALPDPEAGGFSIPDLPVSVSIGLIEARELILGEPVLGQRVALALSGSAELNEAVRVNAEARRIDGREGRFDLAIEYERDTNRLVTRLNLQEAPDGIAANVLNLPGKPSVALQVQGEGPVSDFTATLALSSDGQERLTGEVRLDETAQGLGFDARVGGDLTALLLPQARAFFGPDVQLVVQGVQAESGLDLERLELQAAALSVEGALRLDARNRPVLVDLDATIADGDDRVLLPFGADLSVARAELSAAFDAERGEDWQLTLDATALRAPGVEVPRVTLNADGALGLDAATSFVGEIRAQAETLLNDPALAQAVGRQVELTATLDWQSGAPVQIDELRLVTDTLEAGGSGSLAIGDGITFDGVLRTAIRDLSDFALVAGLEGLDGSAGAELTGQVSPLAGSFDLLVEAETRDLALGIGQADPFLAGETTLQLGAARNAEGIALRRLDLRNDALQLGARGALNSSAGQLTYNASIAEAGRVLQGEGGDFTTQGQAEFNGTAWSLTGDGRLTEIETGQAQLDAALKGGAELEYAAVIGPERTELDRLSIRNDQIAARVSGTVAPDLDLKGEVELPRTGIFLGTGGGPARFDLVARDSDAGLRLTVDGFADDVQIGVDQVDALLTGRTRGNVALTLTPDAELRIERAALQNPDFTANAAGTVSPNLRMTAQLSLPRSGVLFGTNGGPAQFDLAARQGDDGLALSLNGFVRDARIGVPPADALLAGRTTADVAVTLGPDGAVQIRRVQIDGASLTASATGSVKGEQIDLGFNAAVRDVARLTNALSGPLSVSGEVGGTVSQPRFDLDATGPGGATVSAQGRAGLPGGAVDVAAQGVVPLALLDSMLDTRSIQGQARFDISLRGVPAVENVTGQVTVSEARFFDPGLDLVLDNLSGRAELSGGQARVDMRANVEDGGVTVTGPVALSAPFRSDLSIRLNSVPVARAQFLTTRVSGDLTLSGAILSARRVSGALVLNETELRIPTSVSGSAQAIPPMDHVNVPADVRRSQARAGLLDQRNSGGGGAGGGAAGSTTLDITVSTGDPIFLRGRGVDAELGGQIRVFGALPEIAAQGQFNLNRGRMTILGQRLEFNEGRITFSGSLVPRIYLEAASTTADYVITIILEGPATSPEISFSSQPDLPDDEILAQLFFSRPVAELSAFQAARLAAGIAELAGDGSPGVLDEIREGLGVDDLDISTAEDGETALRVGKYIDDNIYTDVQVTSGGNTSVSINLDLTDNVVVKGTAESDGSTGIGIFFEKDY